MEIACPRGPDDCPIFTEIESLRAERDRLIMVSNVDPLTELFNFRYLITTLDREMERTRRTKLRTGLIMIDMDRFKSINDRYGHQVGNSVLKLVSLLWNDTIRETDIACRYGGEEFAIILPSCRRSRAISIAERLRAAVAATRLSVKGGAIRVTASSGVDAYRAHEILTPEEFVARADKNLLEAKRRGRDRVHARADPIPDLSADEKQALRTDFLQQGAQTQGS